MDHVNNNRQYHHIEERRGLQYDDWTRVGGSLAKSQAFWKVRFTAFRYKAAFTLFDIKGTCILTLNYPKR